MRIVFLDGETLDFGGVSFERIEKLGAFVKFKQTSKSQLAARLRNAEVVISNKFVMDESAFKLAPKLKLICVAATGYNNIDIEAARRRGVAVCNVAGYSTESVVQWTIAFILSIAGRLPEYVSRSKKEWPKSPSFVWPGYPIAEIAGKTLGIIGYGTIGKRVAAVAKSLGMKVLIARIPGRKYSGKSPVRVPLNSMLKQSDFVSLHAPLSPQTDRIMNAARIRQMKPTASLINMGRGQLVDSAALAQALKKGAIAAAATDVLEVEPPSAKHPLIQSEKCYITPHIAWASQEARQRLIDLMAENIAAFQKSRKLNRIV